MKRPTREDITPSLYGDETINNNRYANKLEKYIEYLENKANDSEVIHGVVISAEQLDNMEIEHETESMSKDDGRSSHSLGYAQGFEAGGIEIINRIRELIKH